MLQPRDCRKWLRKNHPNIKITVKLKKQLESAHERERVRIGNAALGESSGRGRFGGVFGALEKLQRDVLQVASDYTEDTTYVVGEPRVDPSSNVVTFVLSTDNLLLNAYRQSLFGLPQFVCIDTTHRLVVEKHCVMPITTTSPNQKAHVIAYGVCSSEDIAAHAYVVECVRHGVEAIVRERALAGECV